MFQGIKVIENQIILYYQFFVSFREYVDGYEEINVFGPFVYILVELILKT